MKTTTLLLCVLAFTVNAALSPTPATFQIRLVLDNASADSEELAYSHQVQPSGQTIVEKLHVHKKPLLDRSDLKSAAVDKNSITGAPEISLILTAQGGKRFAEVTREHIGHRLAIVVDGKVLSAPVVRAEIPGGKALISGSFSKQEAKALAARLNAKK